MAKIINQITLNGKVNYDPKVSKTAKGGRMIAFILNFYAGKDKEGKGIYGNINCLSFDEDVVNNIENGGKDANIVVIGQLRPNNYEDKNGNKVYGFQLIVNNIGME